MLLLVFSASWHLFLVPQVPCVRGDVLRVMTCFLECSSWEFAEAWLEKWGPSDRIYICFCQVPGHKEGTRAKPRTALNDVLGSIFKSHPDGVNLNYKFTWGQVFPVYPHAEGVVFFGRNNFLQEVSSWAPCLEQALGFAFCLLPPWIRLWKLKLSFTGFGPWPWGKKSSSGLSCRFSGFQPSLVFCNLRNLFSCQLTHAFKMIIKKNSNVIFSKVG